MLNVLLIANYENDRQESMLRFASLLESELQKAGVAVEVIRPQPWFGRIKSGATGLGKWLGYLDKFLIFPFILMRKVRQLRRLAGKGLVVHICDHSNAFYTQWLRGIPHLVTCNDLLAVRSARGEFPQHNPTGCTGKILQGWICEGLVRAMRITCISQATKEDLLNLTGIAPAKVDVTYMGLNYPYAPMAVDEAKMRVEKLTGGAPYLLHVGGNQWYKNRPGVLHVFAALGESHPHLKLVMVGPAFDAEMNEFMQANPEAAAKVAALHEVDNETLRALYSTAELLLFPSLEEGFGWPIVEAQACGCRVVATEKAPMTEAGGAAAFYFAEREHGSCIDEWAESAARTVRDVLDRKAAGRAEAVAGGLQNAARFPAGKMAQRYVAIYRELLYK